MSEKIRMPARLVRAGSVEAHAPDEGDKENRLVSLSFSSEEPFLRWFFLEDGSDFQGFEILGHEDGEVDLSLLASGRAALLTDHAQTVDSQERSKVWSSFRTRT